MWAEVSFIVFSQKFKGLVGRHLALTAVITDAQIFPVDSGWCLGRAKLTTQKARKNNQIIAVFRLYICF
jgi:hypothetical protein